MALFVRIKSGEHFLHLSEELSYLRSKQGPAYWSIILMSWSVTYIGTPAKITEALEKHSSTITGKSKEEFDAALPHFTGILAQNYNNISDPVLRITASGHGHEGYNTLYVNVEYLNGTLV